MTHIGSFHHLRELFSFLDRMNTNVYEVEMTMEYPDINNNILTEHGTIVQNRSVLRVRGTDHLQRLNTLLEDVVHFRQSRITHVSFTNTILSGTINFEEKNVSIMFHTSESIENIVHQLIDIPMPTFELNLKIFHSGHRNNRPIH